ncbi:cystathionine beta-lyase [Mesorhizobium sp. LSJC265A00]|uniref:trans-sulfuration enzyme family protein n=1 Tax=Mesorhizobium sp. LSJC265A00 TaxID=1287322 RepID=UPI0003CF6F32|nr:PLP-dependent transferase [Mesorhizobium sp. LSJC265A00]ESX10514.1 cystathionine beta-lyase [Mesorhizobium sp. LSJC265A00]
MHDDTRSVARFAVSLEGYDSLTVPIHRASTIRYPDAASFAARFERSADGYVYGLYGTPTHRYLEKKITELEEGARTLLVPSGQAAVACSMLALVAAHEKVLIPDTVYGPVRDFATHELASLGIEAVFYDPVDLRALDSLIDARTRLVWTESPGSITLEMQDIPAIVLIAHAKGALVGCDNTWASPLNFRPIRHGVDIVAEALSKHFSGHSDLVLGSITTRDDALGLKIKASLGRLGIGTSPDDCVLLARGLETLAIRLARSDTSGLRIAAWLAEHPCVEMVIHPALPGSPGHEIWKRDFSGSCGVFTFILKEQYAGQAFAALDALQIISIGASWGGTKSLIAPSTVKALRTVRPWTGPDYLFRLNVGLEHPDDLEEDLQRFFAVLIDGERNEPRSAVRG